MTIKAGQDIIFKLDRNGIGVLYLMPRSIKKLTEFFILFGIFLDTLRRENDISRYFQNCAVLVVVFIRQIFLSQETITSTLDIMNFHIDEFDVI